MVGNRKPHGYWNEIKNQRQFLLDLIELRGLAGPQELSVRLVKENQGSGLLVRYKDFQSALVTLFPELGDKISSTIRKPRNYWKLQENQLSFMLHIQKQYNLNTLKDWSEFPIEEFIKQGGTGILRHHASILDAVTLLHPPNDDKFWESKHKVQKYPRNYFNDSKRQRMRLTEIGELEGVKQPGDWITNGISMNTIMNYAGGPAICKYYKDLLDMVKSLYPEIDFSPKLIGSNVYTFDSFWKDIKTHREFIEMLAKTTKRSRPQWHRISRKEIFAAGGKWLLGHYGTVYNIMITIYPNTIESSWKPLQKQRASSSALLSGREKVQQFVYDTAITDETKFPKWDLTIQKEILVMIGESLGIQQARDWNFVSLADLYVYGIRDMLMYYYTLQDAFLQIFPEEESWEGISGERIRKRNNFFNYVSHQRIWFDSISRHLNISSTKELINLSGREVRELGGHRILSYYGSYHAALAACYPNINLPVLYNKPRNYWASIDNQQKFVREFAAKNKISSISDWESVTQRDFIKQGGSSLLRYYSGLYEALEKLYPDLPWSEHRRKKKPPKFWLDKANVTRFLDTIKEEYYVKQKSDWYRISRRQIVALGGAGLLQEHRKLVNVLRFAYPQYNWDSSSLKASNKRSQQRMLFVILKQLFLDDVEIIEEFVHLDISRTSNYSVEFDVFIPKYNIAIEYQGEHHFKEIPAFGSLDLYQLRDKEKLELCKSYGITLVCIPYWITMTPENVFSYLLNQDNSLLSSVLHAPQLKE